MAKPGAASLAVVGIGAAIGAGIGAAAGTVTLPVVGTVAGAVGGAAIGALVGVAAVGIFFVAWLGYRAFQSPQAGNVPAGDIPIAQFPSQPSYQDLDSDNRKKRPRSILHAWPIDPPMPPESTADRAEWQ